MPRVVSIWKDTLLLGSFGEIFELLYAVRSNVSRNMLSFSDYPWQSHYNQLIINQSRRKQCTCVQWLVPALVYNDWYFLRCYAFPKLQTDFVDVPSHSNRYCWCALTIWMGHFHHV